MLPSVSQKAPHAMAATLAPYTVVLPGRAVRSRAASDRRNEQVSTQVYVRRRLLVLLVVAAVLLALVAGGGNVLANRGGAPASTSAVRPATSYVVQPGDTLWSIAEAVLGGEASVGYVDSLVALNGGASLQVGQVISLP